LRHLAEYFRIAGAGEFEKRHAFGFRALQRLIEKPANKMVHFRGHYLYLFRSQTTFDQYYNDASKFAREARKASGLASGRLTR